MKNEAPLGWVCSEPWTDPRTGFQYQYVQFHAPTRWQLIRWRLATIIRPWRWFR